MSKLVSVIIPVKNGSNYIREALDSIVSQGIDIEIIVVDDASTDDTARIVGEYGCKVLSHLVTKGPVAGKNSGLAVAGGEYVIFLDHDDKMRPGALSALYEALDSDPDAAAVEAKVKDFISFDAGPMPGILIREEPYHGLFTGAILIRRSVFDKIGPFCENVYSGEIMEWFSKMERNHLNVKKIDLVSTDRRIHRTNFGQTNKATEMRDYATTLRNILKQKKQV